MRHLKVYTFLIADATFWIYVVIYHKTHLLIQWLLLHDTHLWPFSKSKLNLKSDRVNLVAAASPIEGLLYLTNVRGIQYKLGPEWLTRLGHSNVLRLPVMINISYLSICLLSLLPCFQSCFESKEKWVKSSRESSLVL